MHLLFHYRNLWPNYVCLYNQNCSKISCYIVALQTYTHPHKQLLKHTSAATHYFSGLIKMIQGERFRRHFGPDELILQGHFMGCVFGEIQKAVLGHFAYVFERGPSKHDLTSRCKDFKITYSTRFTKVSAACSGRFCVDFSPPSGIRCKSSAKICVKRFSLTASANWEVR